MVTKFWSITGVTLTVLFLCSPVHAADDQFCNHHKRASLQPCPIGHGAPPECALEQLAYFDNCVKCQFTDSPPCTSSSDCESLIKAGRKVTRRVLCTFYDGEKNAGTVTCPAQNGLADVLAGDKSANACEAGFINSGKGKASVANTSVR